MIWGKLKKLVDAQFLLSGAFLKEILTPAKCFSLVTQKEETNIMEIVDSVDKTKRDYDKLFKKKVKTDENAVFELPLLKSVLEEIENNKDGEPIYQGQRLNYFSRSERFTKDHCILVNENVLVCYPERYWGNLDEESNNNTHDGDHMILNVSSFELFIVACSVQRR